MMKNHVASLTLPHRPPPSGLAVTGSGGRIGQMLRRIWARGDTTWLTRKDILVDRIADHRCLVALAGVTSGGTTDMTGNGQTALDALEAAAQAGVARVLLFSSAAIYGQAEGDLTEDRPPTPISPYGTAKAEMERDAMAWAADHPSGPEVVLLRLGNVAGADALLSYDGATPQLLHVFPDGRSPRRSYIGPICLAQTLANLAGHPTPLPPVLNISAPTPVEMSALLDAAGRPWTARAATPGTIAEVRLNTALLTGIAAISADAADPAHIVAEWRAVTA